MESIAAIEDILLPLTSRLWVSARNGQLFHIIIHHVDFVREFIQDCGVLLLFLPPYSLDFTPIESVFVYVKQYLRRHDGDFCEFL